MSDHTPEPKLNMENAYTAKAVYMRLLSYAKPYKWVFALAIFGLCLTAVANGFFIQQVEPLIEKVFVENNNKAAIWVPFLIFFSIAVRALGSMIGMYGMEYVAMSVIRDVRQQLFVKYLHVPSASHDQSSSGDALGKVIYNVGLLSYSSSKAITVLIGESLTVIYLLVLMFSMSIQLTLVFLVLVPVLAGLVTLSNKWVKRYSERIQNSMGNVAQTVNEILSAHRVMKAFGGQVVEANRFEKINNYNRKQELKLALVKSIVSPFVQLILGLTLGVIVYIAANHSLGTVMTAGKFMAFFLAMAGIFAPIRALTKVNLEIQRGITAAQSVFEVLDAESELNQGDVNLERAKGDIEFKHTHFAYNENDGDALKGINLKIKAGQTVAFVGQSGSGKTTLVSLLPRFYDVTQGEIALDGHNIQDYSLENLRKQISYVGQDLRLFDDTIANNIAYGELNDKDLSAIRKAADAARATEFIEAMPNGFDAVVGEGGTLLSGGQRQRIAIARALLKDSPILILDEATSALDTESERHIQSALNELVKNRTTLVIAHRLSTIENADVIVVMDQGQILEQGSHSELIKAQGVYAKLHAMQFGQSEPVQLIKPVN